MRPKHTLLLSAIVAALAACNSTAPSEARAPALPPAQSAAEQAQLKDSVAKVYAQTKQIQALDARCDWLTPIDRVTLAATHAESRAWLAWRGESLDEADAQADVIIEQEQSLPCNDASVNHIRSSIGYLVWQMRGTWALRGHGLLDGGERPAWMSGRSSAQSHRASLEAAVDGLRKLDAPGVEQSQARFADEAQRMLAAVRCPATEAGCPSESFDAATRAYAEVWLEQAEAYAEALEGEADKTGLPTEPPAAP